MVQSVGVTSNQTLNANVPMPLERSYSARVTVQGKPTTYFCFAATLIVQL